MVKIQEDGIALAIPAFPKSKSNLSSPSLMKLKEWQILAKGYFVMFIFSYYANLVTEELQEQHLKAHIKWLGILQSSRDGAIWPTCYFNRQMLS